MTVYLICNDFLLHVIRQMPDIVGNDAMGLIFFSVGGVQMKISCPANVFNLVMLRNALWLLSSTAFVANMVVLVEARGSEYVEQTEAHRLRPMRFSLFSTSYGLFYFNQVWN